MSLRILLNLIPLFFITISAFGQLHQDLYNAYDDFREPSIETRRFKQADIMPLMTRSGAGWKVDTAGYSIQGREILSLQLGQGDTRVLLWSQMHGDEPTATMAIMDLLNFFSASGDDFDPLRRRLLDNLSIYFVPMLNPDGAEQFQRRNALGVDLNRDALRLQSPEAKLLKHLRDSLDADWGFNLHDQNRYYAAGNQPNHASISFLAPAYNFEKDINEVRSRSMQLIGLMNEVLQAYLPNRVGKYSDAFEPRAFGDNIQKWGTSTILIESGAYPNDPEKQFLRKLHFVVLLTALDGIATGAYQAEPLSKYRNIPFNNSGAYQDVLLQGVTIQKHGQPFLVDIAIKRREREFNQAHDFRYEGVISDLGDLSPYYGFAYQELPEDGLRASVGKIYPRTITDTARLNQLQPLELLRQGYTEVLVEDIPQSELPHPAKLRYTYDFDPASNDIAVGGTPSLILEKEGEVVYAVVNGFLVDLRDRE